MKMVLLTRLAKPQAAMRDFIQIRHFSEINLNDPFFDSLKSDYIEFEDWFQRKSEKKALIFEEDDRIIAFLYLKPEDGPLDDIVPTFSAAKRLKIGTFKIEAHGTKLGERFLKKIFDYAVNEKVEEVYVTIFPKHEGLVRLFQTFGFVKIGEKQSSNGTEDVYARKMDAIVGDTVADFPYFSSSGNRKFMLAIYPEFHTRLFADSILDNESFSIVKDRSHTNSIHKIYVSWMKDLEQIKPGDLLVIYRTSDQEGRAWYRSVATSVCTVLETKKRQDFSSIEDYVNYCEKYSVFDPEELKKWWIEKPNRPLFVIKMVYNSAFGNRLTRKCLVEDVGLDSEIRWGFFELSDEQFKKIVELGGVENLRIN